MKGRSSSWSVELHGLRRETSSKPGSEPRRSAKNTGNCWPASDELVIMAGYPRHFVLRSARYLRAPGTRTTIVGPQHRGQPTESAKIAQRSFQTTASARALRSCIKARVGRGKSAPFRSAAVSYCGFQVLPSPGEVVDLVDRLPISVSCASLWCANPRGVKTLVGTVELDRFATRYNTIFSVTTNRLFLRLLKPAGWPVQAGWKTLND